MEDIQESRARQGTVDFRAPITVKKTYRFLGMNREEGVAYILYNSSTIYRCNIYLGEVRSEVVDYYELSSQSCQPGWQSIDGFCNTSQEIAGKIVEHLSGEQKVLAGSITSNLPERWYKRFWRKVFAC